MRRTQGTCRDRNFVVARENVTQIRIGRSLAVACGENSKTDANRRQTLAMIAQRLSLGSQITTNGQAIGQSIHFSSRESPVLVFQPPN
jgi:hypothetical protein